MATGTRTSRDLRPVLIAGGGIGGLALSLALARIGWPSLVAERRDAWSEAGAGIQLSPNGVKVLEQIGAADGLRPLAAAPERIEVRDAATARLLQEIPLGRSIADRHGAPYWLAHRRDLQAALVARVEAEPLIAVAKGFEVASVADHGTGVTIRASDGRTLEGEALVAADGVFSAIRQSLFATPPPAYSGWTAARTVVDAASLADTAGPVGTRATGAWLAPTGHVVHYPVRAGREIAVVVVRAEPPGDLGWSLPADAAAIERALASFAPAFGAALGPGRNWRRWALFRAPPLTAWSKGRVTLLGDAAHPTLPFLAQGGVLALEDAATLAAHLAEAGVAGIASAFAGYESARAERATKVVAAAARNGRIFHLSGPAAIARNAAMRLIPGERVARSFDWLYGWTPPDPASG